ncbi:Crp/Fnr family transcriptional regulator [Roseivirga sp. E12]|uniref:Crp/Fnr family transcriptional regulator n=1 Tax=Roseivirga sp. E12 TaxID=2819237 RepID=UPI001ABC3E80|nr:Crp/Fnr family transcriptional regulator [Roseivirga sp. E12]MBO3699623.1 Crp/Fnr family transcriptional regulator [Roseivirga sp. E12]
MYQSFLKSIKKVGNFSQEQLDQITDRIEVRTLKRNDFLLKEGTTSQSLYFLNSGSLRHYKDIDGYSELTINLFIEGDWVLDHHSFVGQRPSENNIQAFEDSTVLELPMHVLHDLIAKSPSFFMLGKILENAEPTKEESIKSPEDKYRTLMENSPQIIQRFPLKHIASYLGMTPETLSRVRSKIKD